MLPTAQTRSRRCSGYAPPASQRLVVGPCVSTIEDPTEGYFLHSSCFQTENFFSFRSKEKVHDRAKKFQIQYKCLLAATKHSMTSAQLNLSQSSCERILEARQQGSEILPQNPASNAASLSDPVGLVKCSVAATKLCKHLRSANSSAGSLHHFPTGAKSFAQADLRKPRTPYPTERNRTIAPRPWPAICII